MHAVKYAHLYAHTFKKMCTKYTFILQIRKIQILKNTLKRNNADKYSLPSTLTIDIAHIRICYILHIKRSVLTKEKKHRYASRQNM